MNREIPRRIILIRELAKNFYLLPDKALIDKPNDMLRVADIISIQHINHPHKDYRIYISRRALKHIVEERKSQLLKHHNEIEVLLRICFIVEQMPEIILNFDKYEYERDPQKYFYTKHYDANPSVRILCITSKQRDNALEICSIHFRKQTKDK